MGGATNRKRRRNTMRKTVKYIGQIGIDAGLCWLGDPWYILHAEPKPKAIGDDWSGFCDVLNRGKQYPTAHQFNYDLGHPGLGVCFSTGYGDGVYPVYATFNSEGRIAKVCVEFIRTRTTASKGRAPLRKALSRLLGAAGDLDAAIDGATDQFDDERRRLATAMDTASAIIAQTEGE